MESDNLNHFFVKTLQRLLWLFAGAVVVIWVLIGILWFQVRNTRHNFLEKKAPIASSQPPIKITPSEQYFKPADVGAISDPKLKESVLYGKELIAHTAKYLGPKGSVKAISNGMNCQNCHLDAGTKPFGNNYFATAANYPRFRARSGTIEDLPKRINDCFERSLNGKPLERDSKEMKAIVDYISYLGKEVPKGEKPKGSGIYELDYLDRAADPIKGAELYKAKCQSCHRQDGQGVWDEANREYTFPPLWGKNSYNIGAGLYRLSRLAGYIKYNMPQGASVDNVILSDEEAWDIAAYINSQPRPSKDISKDWPDISQKPIDHPFGPFNDGFDETHHKFGPFKPIVEARKKLQKK